MTRTLSIVERLRDPKRSWDEPLMLEAADEIERLRTSVKNAEGSENELSKLLTEQERVNFTLMADNERLRAALKDIADMSYPTRIAARVARAALEGK